MPENLGSPLDTSLTSIPSILLRRGSRRAEVLVLESKLRQLGFFTGNPDEIFDDTTEAAVIKFQRFTNIKVDGIVGPQTWAALFTPPTYTTTGLPDKPYKWAIWLVVSGLGYLTYRYFKKRR